MRALLVLAVLLSFGGLALAEVKKDAIDPHGKEGFCHHCHGTNDVDPDNLTFKMGTIDLTCLKCHSQRGATMEDYLRRMLPDVEIKDELIVYFLEHHEFSCHTCHNVMCKRSSKEDLLFRNPHIQLDENGEIIEHTCLFCHTMVPDWRHPDPEHANMRYDITYLCSICHAMSTEKRGLGFGEPMTREMVEAKERFEEEHDVSLPLGPGDTVVCASCHSPHQSGVILGKKGRGEHVEQTHALVVDDPWELCKACHTGRYYQ